jgi:hypothetical protein
MFFPPLTGTLAAFRYFSPNTAGKTAQKEENCRRSVDNYQFTIAGLLFQE